jgi:hypothetical protein
MAHERSNNRRGGYERPFLFCFLFGKDEKAD